MERNIGYGTVYAIAKKDYGWTDSQSLTVSAQNPATTDEDSRIRQLAKLSTVEYERVRKAEAKSLDMRAPILDRLIKAERKQLGGESGEQAGAGSAINFEDIEPWPDPVDGSGLIAAILATLKKYVVADEPTLVAAALWVVLSWLVEWATVLPIALITASEKGCGKSTLLNAMLKMSRRAIFANSITGPALFRIIEKEQPTLGIDEADSFLPQNDELRGVINAGHVRGQADIYRTVEVDGDFDVRRFNTFCAKAVSGIGKPHATIISRSIQLVMRRKHPDERVANLRHADHVEFHELNRKLTRWAADNGPAFAGHRPDMEKLYNRDADNWEPLLSIADIACGTWPARARGAAERLLASEDVTPTANEELLYDIREVFDRTKVERLHTHILLDELCKDPEARWATYNRGKPMAAKQLS